MKRHSVQTQEETPKKPVAGYLRVSTDGQEDGNGLDVQRQHIVAYAAVQGVQVEEWFHDVESGAKEERPGLDALREAVAAGRVGTLLVYRMDRLARESLLAEQLYRELSAKTRVVSVSESLGEGFTGDLMRRILAAFADYERAVILARTSNGRRESVRKNGTFAGGAGVLGYRPTGQRGTPGKGVLRVVEREAEAVRLIFTLRGQGTALQGIAAALNAQGFKTKDGAEFSHVQVLRVLNREAFYRGEGLITRSVEAVGAHTAIL